MRRYFAMTVGTALAAWVVLGCFALSSGANPTQVSAQSDDWRFRSPKANEARNRFQAAMSKAREEFAAKAAAAKGALRLDLEKAMKESTQMGDLDEAVAIRTALRDIAEDSIPEAAESSKWPLGRWTVRFVNGVSGVYEFNAGGTVRWIADQDKTTTGGRLSRQNGAFVIDYDDERLERLTPSGNHFAVEHWFPKSRFPGSKPNTVGTASRWRASGM